MNASQVHGTFKDYIGKVQEQAGKLTGNKAQQLRGLQRQVLGRAERKVGDFQQTAKHASAVNRRGSGPDGI